MAQARLLSPEELGKLLLERLPDGRSVFIWNVWQTISWITLPVAFVSQVSDLETVYALLMQARETVVAAVPTVSPILAFFVDVVGLWRALTTPIRDAFALALPQTPDWVSDSAMIAGIMIPPIVRLVSLTTAVRDFAQNADLITGRRLVSIVEAEERDQLSAYMLDTRKLKAGRRAIRSSMALAIFAGLLVALGLTLAFVDYGAR